MSDYLFSSTLIEYGQLSSYLSEIYTADVPLAQEFHGSWGSLAVTRSQYHGFQPYENELHLLVVIGGPVLYFRDNDFLIADDSNKAAESIYQRWVVEDRICWDEDLSGPFAILLVDKSHGGVTVVTDLMAFIPVYTCRDRGGLYLGTHVDALARVAGQESNIDEVSMADFVLNDVVTYPYTMYQALRQLPPSSRIMYDIHDDSLIEMSYWEPKEISPYQSIQEAADALREGINGYVERITEGMSSVAQFISAGEDSRSLAGILPKRLKRDGFVFLDSMNREGRIARQVSEVYGVNFHVGYRKATHYLDILLEARKLIGSGHQYFHAHSLGFDATYKLATYDAVFGGYLSDSLLKAVYARKPKGLARFPFLPEFSTKGESRTEVVKSEIIGEAFLEKITRRRNERFDAIKAERPATAHEWFVLRPATMRVAIPNLYTTRRLFRSYEPFMCKEAVKISASVPTSWKLNRRLFNRAMKPYLSKSKWILHADGRLPYFSWPTNVPLQFGIWLYRQIAKRIGLIRGNEGAWGDWDSDIKSPKWLAMVEQCGTSAMPINILKKGVSVEQALTSEHLSVASRVNLMQSIYPDPKRNSSV